MRSIMADIAGDAISLVITFVLCLVALCVLLARRQAIEVIGGLLRTLGWVFSSPFQYLRGVVTGLTASGRAEDVAALSSKHFLLYRLLRLMGAVVLVLAAGVLTVGLRRAWDAGAADPQTRAALKEMKSEVRTLSERSAKFDEEVDALDRVWLSTKDSMMTAARTELQARQRAADSTMDAIAARARGQEGMELSLSQVMEALSGPPPRNRDRAQSMQRSVADRLRYSFLEPDERSLLMAYGEQWLSGRMAAFDLAELTDERVRGRLQPDYGEIKRQADFTRQNLEQLQQRRDMLRQSAQFHTMPFVWQLVKTFFSFIGLVWALGLLVEWLWLGVDIAANVQAIRESTPTSKSVE